MDKSNNLQVRHIVLKIVAFPVGFLALFVILSILFQPIWMSWNNFSTFRGFYEEPDDTIETIFLGPSSTITGITPMEMYEDYGICSYNLGSEQQPMMVSYYWMREAYQHHPNTLKTIVLQCVELNRAPDIAFYRKALDAMHPSSLKYQAVREYSKLKGEEKDSFYYYFPFLAYHERWSSLGIDDFLKTDYPVEGYTRGYMFSLNRPFESQSASALAMPLYALDMGAEPAEPNEEALNYLNKIIDFCNENGLELILMSNPSASSASEHNMIASVAEENKLEYLDFSYVPISDDIDFNRAFDTMDGGHLNYYGASKTTRWLGNYLCEKYGATDVRGDSRYAFMDEQLEQYHKEVLDVVSLKEEQEFCDYLKLASQNNDYAIFLSVRDEGSGALKEEDTKEALSEMGFETLLMLGYRESYLALIEEGKIVFEATNGKNNVARTGRLQNGRPYNMNSGGAESVAVEGDKIQKGMISSCIIDGVERSVNRRGINIVIYNERTNAIVDSTVFDTFVSTEREAGYLPKLLEEESAQKPFAELSANMQKLYLYDYRCSQERKIEQSLWGDNTGDLEETEEPIEDFFALLDAFEDDENVSIYLTSKGDVSGLLTSGSRMRLESIGLSELANFQDEDAYVGALHNGKVCLEKKEDEVVRAEYDNAKLASGGNDPEAESYIMTDNTRKDVAEAGLNIVLYDKELKMVIYVGNFAREDAQ